MVLYIIGNGFDIDHGIKCKYIDFCEFLKRKNPKMIDSLNDLFDENELWSDFENALGNPNKEFISKLKKLFDLNIFDNNFAENLKKSYQEWAVGLQLGNNEKYILNKDDFYFSFNYTATLEMLYDIPLNNVKHIHGSVIDVIIFQKKNCQLIVGHGVINCNEDDDAYELLKNTEKNCEEIIKNNESYFDSLKNFKIDNIKCFGFSYSNIDFSYFEKLNNIFPNAKWMFGYHSNKDKDKASEYARKLKLPNGQFKIIKNENIFTKRG